MERKEAIEVIKKNWPDSNFTMLREALETLIPELAESEDEKIRKTLIDYFNTFSGGYYGELKIKDIIAWLEKQQDNTNIEQVFRPLAGCCIDTAAKQAIEQQKTGKNMVLAFNGCYIPVENNTVDEIVNEYNAWLKKQGEQNGQKSTWSEEDEKILNDIIGIIRPFGECPDYPTGEDRVYYYGRQKKIDWLTSLKKRIKS